MNRGAGRRIVFRDDAERLVFVDPLAEMEERFGVEIHSYCLMGNHYHAMIRSAEGRISEAMAWLGSRFTLAVNRHRDVDGAIFRGRFHSVLVERDAHVDWLYRYVNANPVDLGWSRPLSDYPWSGHAVTLGERDDQPWLRTEYYRHRFGEDPNRLDAWVEAARRGDDDLTLARPVGLDEIAQAARVASGPGPGINSAAHVRAATTSIALREGVDESEACHPLAGASALAYRRRVEAAAQTDIGLARFIRRTRSVLASDRSHSETVPDTGSTRRNCA